MTISQFTPSIPPRHDPLEPSDFDSGRLAAAYGLSAHDHNNRRGTAFSEWLNGWSAENHDRRAVQNEFYAAKRNRA